MNRFLSYYIEKFKSLKRGLTPQGLAPHKPLLLLSVIVAIEKQTPSSNSFSAAILRPYFELLWTKLVISKHQCNINTPFLHLASEGFWHINRVDKSAKLDTELYQYLQIEKGRNSLTRVLLETYFWDSKNAWSDVFPQIMETESLLESSTAIHCPNKPDQGSKVAPIFNDEIDTLDITPLCVQYLKNDLHIHTAADFISLDITRLTDLPGIGIGKIKQLREKQLELKSQAGIPCDKNVKTKYQNSILSPTKIKIDKLDLSPNLLKALHAENIITINDFCLYDLDNLRSVYGVGEVRISYLQQLQTKQRQVHGIQDEIIRTASIPIIQKSREPKNSSYFDAAFSYPYTVVPVLEMPLAKFFIFNDTHREIGSLNFSINIAMHLKSVGFFDFDEIEMLTFTTIGYFYRCFGSKYFCNFWEEINKSFPQNEKLFQIQESPFFNEKYESLSFCNSIVEDQNLQFLRKAGIVTFSDYNNYLQARHSVSPDFIEICNFHAQNASRLDDFQNILMSIPSGKAIEAIAPKNLEKRVIRIYMSRIREKKILDDVAREFGLTRERIRQITKDFDDTIRFDSATLLNSKLNVMSSLLIYFNALFTSYKGILSTKELQNRISIDFGWDADSIGFVTHFIEINSKCVVDRDYIYMQNISCLRCEHLHELFATELQTKKNLNAEQQCALAFTACAHCNLPSFSSDACLRFLSVFYELTMPCEVVFDNETSELYLESEFSLRKGSRKSLMENLFKNRKIMTFDELFCELSKYREDMTERKVSGYIQNTEVVLADRGQYMLKTSLPDIPSELYCEIIRNIEMQLIKTPKPLYSLAIPYKKYQKVLTEIGCTTAYILYEILKDKAPKGIRFIKCPYVTTIDNTERFSISDLIEDYISDNGKTPLMVLRDHFCKKLGISNAVFTTAYTNSNELLVDDDNCLLLIDDLNISKKDMHSFEDELSRLKDSSVITANKLFIENKATCLMLNITGPKLLFNILHMFYGESYSFKFPQIAKNGENIVAIRQMIIDFIKGTQSFCTNEQIEAFCSEKHISERNLYFPHYLYPELFRYLSGAWVHRDVIGWNPEWLSQISIVAKQVLEDSNTPRNSYAYLDNICEQEDHLPKLSNDLFWTTTLVAEMLEATGEFIIYGKNKMVFSYAKNELQLKNFGDLCALLLDEVFEGATNLHKFSVYLRNHDLISNMDLHDSLLHGSNRIIINGLEIYTNREELDKC